MSSRVTSNKKLTVAVARRTGVRGKENESLREKGCTRLIQTWIDCRVITFNYLHKFTTVQRGTVYYLDVSKLELTRVL